MRTGSSQALKAASTASTRLLPTVRTDMPVIATW